MAIPKKFMFQGFDVDAEIFVVGTFTQADVNGTMILTTYDENLTDGENEREVLTESVGRYARVGANGIDIFEHDIVRLKDKQRGDIFLPDKYQVTYDEETAMFFLENMSKPGDNVAAEIFEDYWYEVYKIGNVYDEIGPVLAKKYK